MKWCSNLFRFLDRVLYNESSLILTDWFIVQILLYNDLSIVLFVVRIYQWILQLRVFHSLRYNLQATLIRFTTLLWSHCLLILLNIIRSAWLHFPLLEVLVLILSLINEFSFILICHETPHFTPKRISFIPCRSLVIASHTISLRGAISLNFLLSDTFL